MKRLLTMIGIVCAAVTSAIAQNIQLHYDLGSALYKELDDRPKLTTTIEMFNPDKWGSTYFFVDMDYADGKVASGYWEIVRELQFWKAPVAIHIEYNGGTLCNNSYLGGVSYNWSSKDLSKGFSITAMYKYNHHNPEPNSFQITGTWHVNFAKEKFSFVGFLDFWREVHEDSNGNRHNYVFNAEPQFWVNLWNFKRINDKFKLSVGTEWKISHDFAMMDGFYLNPTIALRWSFDWLK